MYAAVYVSISGLESCVTISGAAVGDYQRSERIRRWWSPFFTGPILLEDYALVEKIATFDRERIPERVVHARGVSAKGFFEVTHDVSHLTCADFLRAPGVQTPLIVRFSTVIHERGSPETLRDPRGFAVKFYTREVDWKYTYLHTHICKNVYTYMIFLAGFVVFQPG